MAINIQTRIDVSGPAGELGDIARKMRRPRPLLMAVGLQALTSAGVRLNDVLSKKTKDAVRTHMLDASLNVGNVNSIFELGEYQVEVGSNLPYAAQVQYGGTIPRDGPGPKALAIPIPVELKRSRLWPSDLDPNRELLKFVPYTGSKPNVFGLLFDPEGELGYGKGPLYALAYYVIQEAKPFLYFSDEDVRIINEELWPKFLGMSPA